MQCFFLSNSWLELWFLFSTPCSNNSSSHNFSTLSSRRGGGGWVPWQLTNAPWLQARIRRERERRRRRRRREESTNLTSNFFVLFLATIMGSRENWWGLPFPPPLSLLYFSVKNIFPRQSDRLLSLKPIFSSFLRAWVPNFAPLIKPTLSPSPPALFFLGRDGVGKNLFSRALSLFEEEKGEVMYVNVMQPAFFFTLKKKFGYLLHTVGRARIPFFK